LEGTKKVTLVGDVTDERPQLAAAGTQAKTRVRSRERRRNAAVRDNVLRGALAKSQPHAAPIRSQSVRELQRNIPRTTGPRSRSTPTTSARFEKTFAFPFSLWTQGSPCVRATQRIYVECRDTPVANAEPPPFSKQRLLQWVHRDSLVTFGNDSLCSLRVMCRRLSCRPNTEHHFTYRKTRLMSL
jgi:hypothetical protein